MAIRMSSGVVTALILWMLTAAAPAAWALCVTPPEEGVWENIDAATGGITRAEIHLSQCGDVCLNGVCPPTRYRVRLWGACSPTDCDWGRVTGQRDGDWIRVTYAFGFKTSYVWIKTYDFYGLDYLRVYIWNDYHDHRTDRAFDGWFLPE